MLGRLHFRNDDRGVTLVELLITMVLSVILGTILLTSVVSSQKLFRSNRNEAVGQTDIRTTIERLGRDIRNARALDAGADASNLVLWIDENSDYK
jgi:prepilin-type N-terminal cleavage/methylation domain-containing protein